MDIFEQLAEIRAQEVSENIIKRLLTDTELSVEKIASLSGTSIATVEKIRENLH